MRWNLNKQKRYILGMVREPKLCLVGFVRFFGNTVVVVDVISRLKISFAKERD